MSTHLIDQHADREPGLLLVGAGGASPPELAAGPAAGWPQRAPLDPIQDLAPAVGQWWARTFGPGEAVSGVLVLGAAAVTVLLLVVVVAVGVATVRRARCAAWRRGARWVTVLAPPTTTPDAAQAFWAVMLGTLRPWWRRVVAGQPHLGFDYYLADGAATIRIWVPGPIPAGQVERALTGAWPGARTHTAPAPRAATTAGHPRHHCRRGFLGWGGRGRVNAGVGRVVAAGGVLRLAQREVLPIRGDGPGDPVRMLLAAPGSLQIGETAWVQILARPVPAGAASRRLARTRTGGVPARLAATWPAGSAESCWSWWSCSPPARCGHGARPRSAAARTAPAGAGRTTGGAVTGGAATGATG